jgi:hypothetical protein
MEQSPDGSIADPHWPAELLSGAFEHDINEAMKRSNKEPLGRNGLILIVFILVFMYSY